MTRAARAEMSPVVVLPKKSLLAINLYHFWRDSERDKLPRLSWISRSRYDNCFCIHFICSLITLRESARGGSKPGLRIFVATLTSDDVMKLSSLVNFSRESVSETDSLRA